MERQETLAQLYALRAGLSVISIEKDKVTSIFNEYEQSPINMIGWCLLANKKLK